MSFLPVGAALKSSGAKMDASGDVFQSFCKNFKQLLLQKKYSDADDLLYNHPHFVPIFQRQKTFDCMLEFLLEDTRNDARQVQAARLCMILENQGLDSDFSRLCHASCLVSLGNLVDAKAVLQKGNYPVGYIHEQIKFHSMLGHDPEVELFSACQEFMTKAIAVDSFHKIFMGFIREGMDSKAEETLLGYSNIFPTFRSLKTFDRLLLNLLDDEENPARYQQAIKICMILKGQDLDTEFSDRCHSTCLAEMQKLSNRL